MSIENWKLFFQIYAGLFVGLFTIIVLVLLISGAFKFRGIDPNKFQEDEEDEEDDYDEDEEG